MTWQLRTPRRKSWLGAISAHNVGSNTVPYQSQLVRQGMVNRVDRVNRQTNGGDSQCCEWRRSGGPQEPAQFTSSLPKTGMAYRWHHLSYIYFDTVRWSRVL